MVAINMAVLVQSALVFMTSLLIIFVTGAENNNNNNIHTGRHLCARNRYVRHPVPVRQSYRRPVYRNDLKRVTYQVAYRTVFRMQLRTQKITGCCPGWKKRHPDDENCLQPICKKECINGKCVAPEICMCDSGWSGHKCHIELDECTGRHRCQHKCINTVGSYECACHDGFKLAADKKSCNLCLSCIDEFKEMQQQMKDLTQKIDTLEEEKQQLKNNLTSAVSHYEEAVSAFQLKESKTPSTTTSAYETDTSLYVPYGDHMPLDRLASLSQQISILEEKMADCMCGNNQYYPG